MARKWTLLGLLVVSITPAGAGPRYHHDLLRQWSSHYGSEGGVLNERGDVLFEAQGKLWLNGSEVESQFTDIWGKKPFRMNNNRDVLWGGFENGKYPRLFKNDLNISMTWGQGAFSNYYPEGLNDAGHVLWTGNWGPYYGEAYTYLDATLYNREFGLSTDLAYGNALNNKGQVLWTLSAPPDGHQAVYLDGQEVSLGLGGEGKALNDRGDYLWRASRSDWAGYHVLVNQADLTATYAPSDASADGVALNGYGHALWFYVRAGQSTTHLMVDGNELGVPADLHGINPRRFNDRDEVLWDAGFSTLGSRYLFVNNFNLTDEALGTLVPDNVDGVALNNQGQVLWFMRYQNMNYWYLSTPVPEPSVLLLGLPLLALLVRRRMGKGA